MGARVVLGKGMRWGCGALLTPKGIAAACRRGLASGGMMLRVKGRGCGYFFQPYKMRGKVLRLLKALEHPGMLTSGMLRGKGGYPSPQVRPERL